MTRKEKCILAKDKGFIYYPESGIVLGVKGFPIKKKVNGYISLTLWFNSKRYYLYAHQFAWFIMYGEVVNLIDHKNGVKIDNRKENIRKGTKQQNAWNTKSSGAYLDKRTGRFESLIMIDGKHKYLGKFDTKKEAELEHKKYKSKLLQLWN